MPNAIPQLLIPAAVLAAISDHVQGAFPNEACGFLIGEHSHDGALVRQALATPNSAAWEDQPRAYAIDPRDWIRTEQQVRAQGLAIIGIYHSHPNQSPTISQTDIAALWPNLFYLIIAGGSQRHAPPSAWRLDADLAVPERCQVRLTD